MIAIIDPVSLFVIGTIIGGISGGSVAAAEGGNDAKIAKGVLKGAALGALTCGLGGCAAGSSAPPSK